MTKGFTLIEMSIVLVIIGLLIGGILVGQDMIAAAAVRAQISQIEKYNTAVNTFRVKYGYLPGDMPDPPASQFGFLAGAGRGQPNLGDGNGLITDIGGSAWGFNGEEIMFWSDLGIAGLIDFQSQAYQTSWDPTIITFSTTPPIPGLYPQAKIGQGNYVFVWPGGYQAGANGNPPGDSTNYFGIFVPITLPTDSTSNTAPGLTVKQAYDIDKKIDDGFPQSGKVGAFFIHCYADYGHGGTGISWASGASCGGNAASTQGASSNGLPTTAATPYASTNCYDNNNTAGALQTYSMAKNANLINCALSLQFQ